MSPTPTKKKKKTRGVRIPIPTYVEPSPFLDDVKDPPKMTKAKTKTSSKPTSKKAKPTKTKTSTKKPPTKTRPRQKTPPTRGEIVAHYKKSVLDVCVKVRKEVPVWWSPGKPKVLTCYHIDPNNMPIGFTDSASASSPKTNFQYNYKDPILKKTKSRSYRPKSYRMPFLQDPRFYDAKRWTVSHACHDNACHNWDHVHLASLAVNKGLNGCPGGPHCHHKIRCIIPGPYSGHNNN